MQCGPVLIGGQRTSWLTYRSDEVRASLRHFLAQLDRERLAREILLAHFTREEVEAMLQAIFALPRSARVELADLLYTLTEGNPFFVEEILKPLGASGEIVVGWEADEDPTSLVPVMLADLARRKNPLHFVVATRMLMSIRSA